MKQLLGILFIFLTLNVFGQQKIETINGKKYQVHVVEKNQTLYGIHKQYNVAIELISEANKGIENGLKIGQEILIPIPLTDKNYYQNHVVKKGETLYAISRRYKTKVNDLKSLNPELEEADVQIGQVIIVPSLGLVEGNSDAEQGIEDPEPEAAVNNQVDYTAVNVSSADTMVKHQVLAHETLYSIAKRYMVTADDIRKSNKIPLSTLKVGDIINVPVKKVNYQVFQGKVDSSFVYTAEPLANKLIIKKPLYKVALLLPLMYEANKSMMNRPIKIGEIEKLHPVTEVSADFYHGFKMAADSLVKAGLNAEIYVYDTKRDTNTITKIFQRSEFKDIDMIVGPFFKDEVSFVANYCKKAKVPMILPVNAENSVLYQNPYVFKTTASTMNQMDGMVDFLVSDYGNYNICIVKPSASADKALYDRARDRFNNAVKVKSYSPNIVELDLGSASGRDWNYKLRKDTVNIIVVPSNDVKFVTSVFTRVNNVLNSNTYAKGMKVIVFGLEEWNKIEDIDLKHRIRSEQHYASYRFFDYDKPENNGFVQKYRQSFGADPSVSSAQGFDIGFYFLSAMHLYGENYVGFLSHHQVPLVQNSFKFTSTVAGNGQENSATCIVKYKDYELHLISW